MFNANIISLVLCLQCLLLLPEQLDLAVHRHIQNISSWIRHLDLLFQRPADFFSDNMVVCFGLLVAASGCVSGNCGTVPAETVRDVQNQAAYEEMLSEEMTDEALKVVEESDISDMVSELAYLEEQAAKLEQQYQNAATQFDMTEASGDIPGGRLLGQLVPGLFGSRYL